MPHPFSSMTPLIQVFDMTASLDFYTRKLGFDIIASSPEIDTPEGRFSHWMLLRAGTVELMLNTAYDSGERPAAPDTARITAHADTGFYIGCDDLDRVHADLKRAGLDIAPPSHAPYGRRRFSLCDPDNYELVFQQTI